MKLLKDDRFIRVYRINSKMCHMAFGEEILKTPNKLETRYFIKMIITETEKS